MTFRFPETGPRRGFSGSTANNTRNQANQKAPKNPQPKDNDDGFVRINKSQKESLSRTSSNAHMSLEERHYLGVIELSDWLDQQTDPRFKNLKQAIQQLKNSMPAMLTLKPGESFSSVFDVIDHTKHPIKNYLKICHLVQQAATQCDGWPQPLSAKHLKTIDTIQQEALFFENPKSADITNRLTQSLEILKRNTRISSDYLALSSKEPNQSVTNIRDLIQLKIDPEQEQLPTLPSTAMASQLWQFCYEGVTYKSMLLLQEKTNHHQQVEPHQTTAKLIENVKSCLASPALDISVEAQEKQCASLLLKVKQAHTAYTDKKNELLQTLQKHLGPHTITVLMNPELAYDYKIIDTIAEFQVVSAHLSSLDEYLTILNQVQTQPRSIEKSVFQSMIFCLSGLGLDPQTLLVQLTQELPSEISDKEQIQRMLALNSQDKEKTTHQLESYLMSLLQGIHGFEVKILFFKKIKQILFSLESDKTPRFEFLKQRCNELINHLELKEKKEITTQEQVQLLTLFQEQSDCVASQIYAYVLSFFAQIGRVDLVTKFKTIPAEFAVLSDPQKRTQEAHKNPAQYAALTAQYYSWREKCLKSMHQELLPYYNAHQAKVVYHGQKDKIPYWSQEFIQALLGVNQTRYPIPLTHPLVDIISLQEQQEYLTDQDIVEFVHYFPLAQYQGQMLDLASFEHMALDSKMPLAIRRIAFKLAHHPQAIAYLFKHYGHGDYIESQAFIKLLKQKLLTDMHRYKPVQSLILKQSPQNETQQFYGLRLTGLTPTLDETATQLLTHLPEFSFTHTARQLVHTTNNDQESPAFLIWQQEITRIYEDNRQHPDRARAVLQALSLSMLQLVKEKKVAYANLIEAEELTFIEQSTEQGNSLAMIMFLIDRFKGQEALERGSLRDLVFNGLPHDPISIKQRAQSLLSGVGAAPEFSVLTQEKSYRFYDRSYKTKDFPALLKKQKQEGGDSGEFYLQCRHLINQIRFLDNAFITLQKEKHVIPNELSFDRKIQDALNHLDELRYSNDTPTKQTQAREQLFFGAQQVAKLERIFCKLRAGHLSNQELRNEVSQIYYKPVAVGLAVAAALPTAGIGTAIVLGGAIGLGMDAHADKTIDGDAILSNTLDSTTQTMVLVFTGGAVKLVEMGARQLGVKLLHKGLSSASFRLTRLGYALLSNAENIGFIIGSPAASLGFSEIQNAVAGRQSTHSEKITTVVSSLFSARFSLMKNPLHAFVGNTLMGALSPALHYTLDRLMGYRSDYQSLMVEFLTGTSSNALDMKAIHDIQKWNHPSNVGRHRNDQENKQRAQKAYLLAMLDACRRASETESSTHDNTTNHSAELEELGRQNRSNEERRNPQHRKDSELAYQLFQELPTPIQKLISQIVPIPSQVDHGVYGVHLDTGFIQAISRFLQSSLPDNVLRGFAPELNDHQRTQYVNDFKKYILELLISQHLSVQDIINTLDNIPRLPYENLLALLSYLKTQPQEKEPLSIKPGAEKPKTNTLFESFGQNNSKLYFDLLMTLRPEDVAKVNQYFERYALGEFKTDPNNLISVFISLLHTASQYHFIDELLVIDLKNIHLDRDKLYALILKHQDQLLGHLSVEHKYAFIDLLTTLRSSASHFELGHAPLLVYALRYKHDLAMIHRLSALAKQNWFHRQDPTRQRMSARLIVAMQEHSKTIKNKKIKAILENSIDQYLSNDDNHTISLAISNAEKENILGSYRDSDTLSTLNQHYLSTHGYDISLLDKLAISTLVHESFHAANAHLGGVEASYRYFMEEYGAEYTAIMVSKGRTPSKKEMIEWVISLFPQKKSDNPNAISKIEDKPERAYDYIVHALKNPEQAYAIITFINQLIGDKDSKIPYTLAQLKELLAQNPLSRAAELRDDIIHVLKKEFACASSEATPAPAIDVRIQGKTFITDNKINLQHLSESKSETRWQSEYSNIVAFSRVFEPLQHTLQMLESNKTYKQLREAEKTLLYQTLFMARNLVYMQQDTARTDVPKFINQLLGSFFDQIKNKRHLSESELMLILNRIIEHQLLPLLPQDIRSQAQLLLDSHVKSQKKFDQYTQQVVSFMRLIAPDPEKNVYPKDHVLKTFSSLQQMMSTPWYRFDRFSFKYM